ncbi:hypothetical protein vB_PsyM_KIL3b_0106 [Pseudomonas phage vB_PsyM_KIL3b]|uniref:Uncharacterized protein n=6 Tax=Flaumdravirus TaxID=2560133 RepID=A0A142IE56_9CAUD|nr:hypothetical protein BH774_gp097 [Pseudomonas phage vB_PsyM_KIL1]YP_009616785.1 hypothetical protein FDI83_gp105 [Pseudomonas phage vB_PsyM_KIL4]AMR57511.1 hypothetical protein vB_PsyM_KIL2_0111 [Pseudomonas phage vB_PsyM_KIL2]AMR57673.1 hypothetical protein vB_PsyM_KIL3_0106 [Pseudomonas phage vB_PsyM_KIL3]AMR58001.1 hypothetical protein vB_PsyM_KIL5_0110 [Pseudomonas phage vB_PsyM_KIL5]AMR58171.1 hypothetical protein vB_PsyM_KIL3b_0106 [Pseudomonas phage vB_PsyM_KIL3b]AMR57352.1 hypothet
MNQYRVIKKDFYHMYALGEIIERCSSSEIMGTFIYVNKKGIQQRLMDDQVELVVDTNEEAL